MAPFEAPEVIATGIKEKIDSLLVQGWTGLVFRNMSIELLLPLADRLYLGSSTGTLHIYSLKHQQGDHLEARLLSYSYCSSQMKRTTKYQVRPHFNWRRFARESQGDLSSSWDLSRT